MAVSLSSLLFFIVIIIFYASTLLMQQVKYPYPKGSSPQGAWHTLYKLDSANKLERFNLEEITNLSRNAMDKNIWGTVMPGVVVSGENKQKSEIEYLSDNAIKLLDIPKIEEVLTGDNAFVTKVLANELKIKIGDFITINTKVFRVAAILPLSFNGVSNKASVIVNVSNFVPTHYYQVDEKIGEIIARQSKVFFYSENSKYGINFNNKNHVKGILVSPLVYIELSNITQTIFVFSIFLMFIMFLSEIITLNKWLDTLQGKLALQAVLGSTVKQNIYYLLKIYLWPRLLLIIFIISNIKIINSNIENFIGETLISSDHTVISCVYLFVIFIFFSLFVASRAFSTVLNTTKNIKSLSRSTKKNSVSESLRICLALLLITPVFLTILMIESFSAFTALNRDSHIDMDNLYTVQYRQKGTASLLTNDFTQFKADINQIALELNKLNDYKVTISNASPFNPPMFEVQLSATSDIILSLPEQVKSILTDRNYHKVVNHLMTSGVMPSNENEIAVSDAFAKSYLRGNPLGKKIHLRSKSSKGLKIVGIVKDAYWLDPKANNIPLLWQYNPDFASGTMIIKTDNSMSYLSEINNIIRDNHFTIKVYKAVSVYDKKQLVLKKESTLLIILIVVMIIIFIALFLNIKATIQNYIQSRLIEIKVKLSVGATKNQVCSDLFCSSFNWFGTSCLVGGCFCIIFTYNYYSNANSLIFILLSFFSVMSILVISSGVQIAKIYKISPLDLFKDD